jgi:hypothetical protein
MLNGQAAGTADNNGVDANCPHFESGKVDGRAMRDD